MARTSDIDQIIRAAVDGVVERASAALRKAIDTAVAAELRRVRAASVPGRRATSTRRRRRGARRELTKWVADRRARRVPNFVIEMTGLDTKKKIVAKYGPNAAFEAGEPPPAATSAASGGPVQPVKRAAGPVIRRAKAAAAAG